MTAPPATAPGRDSCSTARDTLVHDGTLRSKAGVRAARLLRACSPGGILRTSDRRAMEPTDLTIEILKGIRDEIRGTNARLDGLERRQVEGETRIATEVIAVASVVREVRDLLREDRALSAQVDDHERRLKAIEARAT